MYESIVRLDLHGKNAYQARVALDAALRRAKGGTYASAASTAVMAARCCGI